MSILFLDSGVVNICRVCASRRGSDRGIIRDIAMAWAADQRRILRLRLEMAG